MPELKDELAALRIEREPDRRRGGPAGVAWIVVIAVLGAGACRRLAMGHARAAGGRRDRDRVPERAAGHAGARC